MADFVNPHARRLYDSLLERTDASTAEEIANANLLSKTPSPKQRANWAESVCRALDDRFDEAEVIEIRAGCACGPAQGKMEPARKCYAKQGTWESVAELLSGHGASAWVEDGAFYLSYPTCYCSFVKGLPERAPRSWCYCTLGYAKRMLECAFGCELRLELIESVQWGDGRCLMRAVKAEEENE